MKMVDKLFIYGAQWKTFKRYAKHNYNLDLTEQQCKEIREAYFSYPRGYYKLPEYYHSQADMVHRLGYVRTPMGRIRRLPNSQSRDEMERWEAERQAVNSPTQGFSSDLCLLAMYIFWQELAKRPKLHAEARLMFMVHDAIYFEASKRAMPKAMALLKWSMETGTKQYLKEFFHLDVGYPITSDAKIGVSWYALADYCDLCQDQKGQGTCPDCEKKKEKA